MKKYFAISIMVLGMIYVFSVYSHAGNPTNASDTGNVTGIVICENNDSLVMNRARIAINSDG